MPKVWRIATEGRSYPANDMSGIGAAKDGGRWNSPGQPMVYSASTLALACLETLVHINNSLPLNRYVVEIDIPDVVWRRRGVFNPQAHVGWDAEPAGFTSISYGDHWAASAASAVLQVPSVIVPEENNYLINPGHPDASQITATKKRRWLYSPRLPLNT